MKITNFTFLLLIFFCISMSYGQVLKTDKNENTADIILSSDTQVLGVLEASEIQGNLTGDVTGNLKGDSTGNHTGDSTGDHTGNVTGNLTGNSAGKHTGEVVGNVTGNVIGNLNGNVSASFVTVTS